MCNYTCRHANSIYLRAWHSDQTSAAQMIMYSLSCRWCGIFTEVIYLRKHLHLSTFQAPTSAVCPSQPGFLLLSSTADPLPSLHTACNYKNSEQTHQYNCYTFNVLSPAKQYQHERYSILLCVTQTSWCTDVDNRTIPTPQKCALGQNTLWHMHAGYVHHAKGMQRIQPQNTNKVH